MRQDRRQFLSLALLPLVLAGAAGAVPAGRHSAHPAAARLGVQLLAELPRARRVALLRLADRLWPDPAADLRTALDRVARDHAARRTVPLGGVLLSETEAAWLLRAAVTQDGA